MFIIRRTIWEREGESDDPPTQSAGASPRSGCWLALLDDMASPAYKDLPFVPGTPVQKLRNIFPSLKRQPEAAGPELSGM